MSTTHPFEKYPIVKHYHRSDPIVVTGVALIEDPKHHSSIVMRSKRELDLIVAFLNYHRSELPD